MKVTISDEIISKDEIESLRENPPPEATPEQFKEHMLRVNEVVLSPQVVEFAAKEMNMTPDEFVAFLLKKAGATQ